MTEPVPLPARVTLSVKREVVTLEAAATKTLVCPAAPPCPRLVAVDWNATSVPSRFILGLALTPSAALPLGVCVSI